MRNAIFFFLSAILLIACSNPPNEEAHDDVQEILMKMKSIDEDTSLQVDRRLRNDVVFDSSLEIHHSKNGHLLKYETRLFFRDTAAKLMIYVDNDSVIYSENMAMYKTDTLWYSKHYFSHGICLKADETRKTDPAFTFSAGQNFIEAFGR